jgi:hypothetical protein
MHSDEYRRLHAACLTMADQSKLPEVQARWRTLAQSCSSLAKDLPAKSRAKKCFEDRSNKKPMFARIGAPLAIAS